MLNREPLWDVPANPIADAADEIDLIKRAASGDRAATMRLFTAYVPALLEAVDRFKRSLGVGDAKQTAFEALLVAIAEFDPAKAERLAATLPLTLTHVMSAAASDAGAAMTVPPRTMQRFRRILAKAGGDIHEGARLAPAHRMPAETFLAVADAVRVLSLEAAMETNPELVPRPLDFQREHADASVRELVALAFDALDDLERDVCRLAYGFADYNPLSDAEIGDRLGMSRTRILRVRHAALGKMRAAVGA